MEQATADESGRTGVMSRVHPGFVAVHLVWSTSGRRALLAPSVEGPLFAELGRQATAVGCTVLAAGCASDHVHALVRLASTITLGDLGRRLKGGSSHALNTSGLLQEPLRWQSGYWVQSIAPADLEALERYVRGQREHHDDGAEHERWLRP